jgi:4-diphosphocytidyl-2-C-methyl-D-erythritol kinase
MCELHAEAARLGSDVNFFLDSAALAVCRGRGEEVGARPLGSALWFVVVKPAAGLSTAAVLQGLAVSGRRRSCDALVEAARALERLRSQGVAGAAMTGSGTACFGVCRSRRHAARVATRLRRVLGSSVFVLRSAV